MAALPSKRVAQFHHRVPCVHRRRGECVADSCVTLRRKPRSAPGTFSSEADALNAELSNDVVHVIVFGRMVHRKAGERE